MSALPHGHWGQGWGRGQGRRGLQRLEEQARMRLRIIVQEEVANQSGIWRSGAAREEGFGWRVKSTGATEHTRSYKSLG